MKPLPSIDTLLQLFTGDFLNGELIHKPRLNCGHPSWNKKFAGRPAGKRAKNGYIVVTIFNKCFLKHRIIWKLVTGEDPGELDHVNRNRADNRFENLRQGTHQQNGFNQGKHANNQSGIKGVHWDPVNAKWIAQIAIEDRHVFLGRFRTMDDAAEAYRAAALLHHGEFACAD